MTKLTHTVKPEHYRSFVLLATDAKFYLTTTQSEELERFKKMIPTTVAPGLVEALAALLMSTAAALAADDPLPSPCVAILDPHALCKAVDDVCSELRAANGGQLPEKGVVH